MADKNYSVDDILSALRAKRQQPDGAPPAPRPAERTYTDEDRRLLEKALEHSTRSHLTPLYGEEEAPPRRSAPPSSRESRAGGEAPEAPSRWQPVAAQTVTPVREEKRERPEAPPFDFSESGEDLDWSGIFEEEKKPEPPKPPTVPKPAAPEEPPRRRMDTAAAARMVTGTFGEEDDFDDGFEKRLLKQTGKAAGTPLNQMAPPAGAPAPHRERGRERGKEARPRREEKSLAARERPGAAEGPVKVGQQLDKMRRGLILRLLVNLLAVAAVVYLALAPEYAFPLPEMLDPAENLSAYLWAAVGAVIVSALVSGNTVGGGMISLFCLRPNNDSYTSLGVFACLVQGAYVAMRPEIYETYSANIYLPMAALMLLFNTLGKFILLGRVGRTYEFAAGKGPKDVACLVEDRQLARRLGGQAIEEDEAVVAYFTRAAGVGEYLDQAFSESKAEDISKIVAPMTAVAALVMAVVSYLFNKDVFIAACVFTAALCITSPLAGVIAANLPLSLGSGKLAKRKTALCGYEAAEAFGRTNGVVLRCSDLFPPASVTLHGIKVLNKSPIDQAILDAASVLDGCDSTLTSIFRELVSGDNILRPVESLSYEDGKGISAWVDGRRVLIGNRELMKFYGVDIPSLEFESRHTQGGREALYLSNSGEAAAMYIISYKADKQMRRVMQLLYDRDIAVCVYTTDPCITPQKIAKVFDFPEDLVEIIPAALHPQVERLLAPQGRQRAGLIHDGTPGSYIRAIAAAQSCSGPLSVETALLLLSVVIGFAVVSFFAFTRTMPTLTWMAVAVYQLFWMLLQLVVPLLRRG